jgi:hypothetical protein
MATLRTWYTLNDFSIDALDVTNLIRANASAMWALKAFLMGQITTTPAVGAAGAPPSSSYWICEGSSDGVTGGMDGVDRWGGTFNSSKLVVGNPGVAHSWIVLRSPVGLAGGPIRLLLACTVTFDNSMSGWLTKETFTGGTQAVNPSVTGAALGALRPFNVIDGYWKPVTSLTAGIKAHFVVDDNGHFCFLISRSGQTTYDSKTCLLEVSNTKSYDPNPWVFHWNPSTLAENTSNAIIYWSLFGNSWHMPAMPRPIAVNIDVFNRSGWPPDAGGDVQLLPIILMYAWQYGTGSAPTNPLDWGAKGTVVDCYYGPAQGTQLAAPATGDIEYIAYNPGGMWLPFTLLPNF